MALRKHADSMQQCVQVKEEGQRSILELSGRFLLTSKPGSHLKCEQQAFTQDNNGSHECPEQGVAYIRNVGYGCRDGQEAHAPSGGPSLCVVLGGRQRGLDGLHAADDSLHCCTASAVV